MRVTKKKDYEKVRKNVKKAKKKKIRTQIIKVKIKIIKKTKIILENERKFQY
jgi:hypothetical protein